MSSAATIEVAADEVAPVGSTLWRDARIRFFHSRGGMIGAGLLALLILAAIFAPLLSPYDPLQQSLPDALQGPSSTHLFGTDEFGRDVFSRVLFGARISLPVGIISVTIAVILGVPLGLISGFYRGIVDTITMRVMDVMLAFPGILLALAIIAILGPSLNNVMISVGISGVPSYARLVRGSVLQAREDLYVTAAQALGVSNLRLMFRHILPNVMAPIIVLASLGVGFSILAASGLSFLGLGAQPPSPEWGAMLSTGRNYLELAWWIVTFPGIMIVITVVALNLVGDALRDALDPRMRFRK